VIAADVYAEPLHKGRGGWTWYTGSAGWMYQLIIHSFIGLKREADTLRFSPCIPAEWKSFEVNYRFAGYNYHIYFIQSASEIEKATEVFLDEVLQENGIVPLLNDGKVHEVRIELFTTLPVAIIKSLSQ
jgi:cellobiose phosphorylase